MYSTSALFSVFFFLVSAYLMSCDREETIVNTWQLSSVLMNGEPLNDSLQFNVIPRYTYYIFSYANILEVRTIVSSQVAISLDGYYSFADYSTLNMEFTLLYKKYSIKAKITKLTRRELNLEYEYNGNVYFLTLFSRT
jgi:hypothetical protein